MLAACGAQSRSVDADSGGLNVRVLSFNIRNGTAPDGLNAWPHRKQLVYDVIRRQDSDFIGLQEALRFQIDAIHEAVPGYGEVGVGREDGKEAGEYSAILYKADRWRVVDSKTRWLSETPDVPGSTTWGNEITRIVTRGRFVEKTSGSAMWVFNTHFDHVSQPSRMESAQMLVSLIADRGPRDPVVVTGDFNAGEGNPAILYLKHNESRVALEDTFRILHPDVKMVGTFGGFEGRRDGPKIDYVFVEPGTRVREAGIIYDNLDGPYASDHYPVYAEIVLPGL